MIGFKVKNLRGPLFRAVVFSLLLVGALAWIYKAEGATIMTMEGQLGEPLS